MSYKYRFEDELMLLSDDNFHACVLESSKVSTDCYMPKFKKVGCDSIIHGINCALHMQKLAIKKNMNIGKRMCSIAKLLELKRIAEEDRDLP